MTPDMIVKLVLIPLNFLGILIYVCYIRSNIQRIRILKRVRVVDRALSRNDNRRALLLLSDVADGRLELLHVQEYNRVTRTNLFLLNKKIKLLTEMDRVSFFPLWLRKRFGRVKS